MENKKNICSVLNEVCLDIEKEYAGSIAVISENIISDEGFSYIIEVFNLNENQLFNLIERQAEFNDKYRKRLGKLLLMELWTIEETMHYFAERLESIEASRYYKKSALECIAQALKIDPEIDILLKKALSLSEKKSGSADLKRQYSKPLPQKTDASRAALSIKFEDQSLNLNEYAKVA